MPTLCSGKEGFRGLMATDRTSAVVRPEFARRQVSPSAMPLHAPVSVSAYSVAGLTGLMATAQANPSSRRLLATLHRPPPLRLLCRPWP